MKKILHILSSNSFSGAENVVCQIISMFSNSTEYKMIYCCPEGVIEETLRGKKFEYILIPKMSVKEVKKAIKIIKPDIIHAHDMRASLISALACGKRKLISHIHNNSEKSQKLTIRSISYLYAALKADKIIWVSNSACEQYYFSNIVKNKSIILYNVIDIKEVKEKIKEDSTNYNYDLIYLGRLTYQKNPIRLIEVLKEVVNRIPETKIAIVGTGEDEKKVKEKISEYGLNNNIDMLGYMSNPYKVLDDSKILIMTSRWEGTPMCALEALALGKIIVSTPADGLKEIVIEGETGFLRRNNNELVEKICDILENPEMVMKMSNIAIKRAKEYNSIGTYRCKLEDIYQ
ncbi:MAG: glycosyltransferase [Lachnospiraceae bacterium]|nr:glycosyltransferase [Lachnospiraceae bacterium]